METSVTTENALASENAPETDPKSGAEASAAVTPAPEAEDTGTSPEKEETGDKAAENAEADKPRKGKPAAERIKELTDQRNAAERRVAELEKRLERTKPVNADPDKFENDADYTRAVAEHTVQSARRAEIKDDIKEAKEAVNEVRRTAWQERVAEFAPSVQDFEEVAYRAPISDAVSELLVDSDFGPQIAYALGKNPARAREISAMPPTKAAIAIGRMEAEMAPKPRKVSNAPPPVETVGGSSRSSEPDPDKLTPAQYRKWREGGGGR